MVKAGKLLSYPELGMAINITQYESNGDSIDRTLSKSSISADTYARKHLVTKGSFNATFKELTDEVDERPVGTIWPPAQERKTAFFKITATQDNSEYLCVVPKNGGRIEHSATLLEQGQSLVVEKGQIAVVSGNYTVNGNTCQDFDVFILIDNVATMVANGTTTVHQFWKVLT
jgi:hypothetical protein